MDLLVIPATVQQISLATHVDSLVTTPLTALRRMLVVELLPQREVVKLQLLVVVA